MAFALDTLPTPEEFAANWYQMDSGQCMDCTADQRAHPGYQKLFLPQMKLIKDAPPINGVPQVKYVNPASSDTTRNLFMVNQSVGRPSK